jgi:uncharacterized protein YchJ
MEGYWIKVPRVEAVVQRKAEKVQRPNDRCACKSGKKFKKCCGR